jgi:hypothetical protein
MLREIILMSEVPQTFSRYIASTCQKGTGWARIFSQRLQFTVTSDGSAYRICSGLSPHRNAWHIILANRLLTESAQSAKGKYLGTLHANKRRLPADYYSINVQSRSKHILQCKRKTLNAAPYQVEEREEGPSKGEELFSRMVLPMYKVVPFRRRVEGTLYIPLGFIATSLWATHIPLYFGGSWILSFLFGRSYPGT